MFDVLEFLDENDNLAIFFGDEVMVRSQNNICLLCLFKFGIRETRTCRLPADPFKLPRRI